MTSPITGPCQSVESLILKATNPLNNVDDPNIIQCICQNIGSEVGGIQTAIRLLVHKMQSPQEKEALQSLLVLQACVNNCGPLFHSEIGKFRFLNEMIKLVSPKYLGNQTPNSIKERVTELLYTWTIDVTEEPKIYEAYTMLKKQGVVKEDPVYLGVPCKIPAKMPLPASFEDDEKSQALQRLLQSTRPEDIVKANALIKNMVKEDERRLERTSRRIVEVETALNNVKVLDEMLNQYEETHCVSKADFELMEELNTSCSTLRSNIHRIVSEMDEKEDGLGELIKATDELFRVMGRYKLIIEVRNMKEKIPNLQSSSATDVEEDTLLDLKEILPLDKNDGIQFTDKKTELILESTDLLQSQVAGKTDSTLLNELEDIFSGGGMTEYTDFGRINPNGNGTFFDTNPLVPPPLIPQKNVKDTSNTDHTFAKDICPANPLKDLDLLGSTLLQESLPQCIPRIGPQFKPQEKVSLNEMKQKLNVLTSSSPNTSCDNFALEQNSMQSNSVNKLVEGLDDVSLISRCSLERNKLPQDDSHPSTSKVFMPSVNSNMNNSLNVTSFKKDLTVKKEEYYEQKKAVANPQLCEVKTMCDLTVSLDEIKPGNQSPTKLIENNGLSLTIHFTENKPREDVSIIVASVTSTNSQPVSNYTLQAVVPKGCKVKLLPPSSTKLSEYSPFLPPPAITHIMLIANPNKLNVSLKVMLSYTINEDFCSEMGELDNLPL